MRGGGGGGGHPGFRGVDIASQKKLNAAAPRIPHLGRRVVALFRPYTVPLIVTGVLVIVGALVSILPLIATFLGLQRFWSSGLGAGSVK